MATEVEETLKRIQSHRGVKGVLIVNTEGQPIRSNLSQVSSKGGNRAEEEQVMTQASICWEKRSSTCPFMTQSSDRRSMC